MIILDTNVISEMIKGTPDAAVASWMAAQPTADLFTTSVTEAEIRLGVALLPHGRRRQALEAAIEGLFAEDFSGRILPFDSAAATIYAVIASERRLSGRPISQFDAQIAAITRTRGATLATRNVRDFTNCGIALIDPWVP